MAKQGSIRHYRQSGTTKAPASLPYGELAVAKDGTVYAGNEANTPVAQAAASHTHTKAQVGLGNVDNTADSAKSVHYAETAGSAVDQTARNAASSAQTTANAAMPKTGGTFTGNVVAYGTNRTSSCLRNIYVNGVSTNYILMVRK